jgi:hypothetical protein
VRTHGTVEDFTAHADWYLSTMVHGSRTSGPMALWSVPFDVHSFLTSHRTAIEPGACSEIFRGFLPHELKNRFSPIDRIRRIPARQAANCVNFDRNSCFMCSLVEASSRQFRMAPLCDHSYIGPDNGSCDPHKSDSTIPAAARPEHLLRPSQSSGCPSDAPDLCS